MMPAWVSLTHADRLLAQTTMIFLEKRMEERATLNWALRLRENQRIERVAVAGLLERLDAGKLQEPWRSAWRLIEESWIAGPPPPQQDLLAVQIRRRLKDGERSGALIATIVDIVKPRIEASELGGGLGEAKTKRRRPKIVRDLMRVSVGSGKLVKPWDIGLPTVQDRNFLMELAQALDSALQHGLDIARRISWDGQDLWRIGQLTRAYFTERDLAVAKEPTRHRSDPDEFHEGIAPVTKLLSATVHFLANASLADAQLVFSRWRTIESAVHARLWASLARDERFASGEQIGSFLMDRDDRQFWNIFYFPEIAELRARRFSDLPDDAQHQLLSRIRRGPPKLFWRRQPTEIALEGRLTWSLRELHRLRNAGAKLPASTQKWMSAQEEKLPKFKAPESIDTDFPEGVRVYSIPSNPDDSLDLVSGVQRLSLIEAALQGERRFRRDEDPGERAADWLRKPGRAAAVLQDLVSLPDKGASYPKTWDRIGWTHTPGISAPEPDQEARNIQEEGHQTLRAISTLPTDTIEQAIEGLTNWIFDWAGTVATDEYAAQVFLKLWPIAAAATEAQDAQLVTRKARSDSAPHDDETVALNTLNSPTGKLVELFIRRFAKAIDDQLAPFSDAELVLMRHEIENTGGRAGLIAKYRLLEHIGYFNFRSPDWSQSYLLPLLRQDDSDSLMLWIAVAAHPLYTDIIDQIGNLLVAKALDPKLSREVRGEFVTSLMYECLRSLLWNRSPAIEYSQLQQTLRLLDEEVRGSAAGNVRQFVLAASSESEENKSRYSPEAVFAKAVEPFFRLVWPQERSLTTPGVARELADLPAACGNEFENCVRLIEPFLVPFDCWSLHDLGVDERPEAKFSLKSIDTPPRAAAFLTLLDSVIGTASGAVVPHGLSGALAQIREVSPKIADSTSFRRLATLSS